MDKTTTEASLGFETGPYASLSGLIALKTLAPWVKPPSAPQRINAQAGGHFSSHRGRGMEFAEVRPYVPGDDIRAMDWKVTARTGKAHTKLFQEEREQQVMLVCDQSRSLFFGSKVRTKSVLAAQLAALLGWRAIANHDRVGALLFNDQQELDFRPTGKTGHFLGILQALTTLNQQAGKTEPGTKDWVPPLQHLHRVLKPGSQVYWISDIYGFNSACDHWLTLIRRHCEISILLVEDALESALPNSGMITLAKGKEQLMINTHSHHLREAYQTKMLDLHRALSACCQRLRIKLMTIKTHEAVLEGLRMGLATKSLNSLKAHPQTGVHK